MTKIRVNTNEMMKFVNGKRMEESDLCMFLEDLGVVLDRSTWTHFKDVYAQSKTPLAGQNKGKIFKSIWHLMIDCLENVPHFGPSSSKPNNVIDEADSEGSDKSNSHGGFDSDAFTRDFGFIVLNMFSVSDMIGINKRLQQI